MCIDCIAGLDSLPEKSVACVVTSPPYNIGIKYGTHDDDRDDYLEWMKAVFVAVKRVLADDGHFFLQVGGTATKPLIPSDVRAIALTLGFVLQNEIIWAKSITVGDESHGHFKPINSPRYLNQTHEFVFHLTKTGKVPVDRLAIGVPFMDKTNIARFGHEMDVRCGGNVWFIPYETANKIKDRPKHPAMFPVALPEKCIKLAGVPKGSLVVDPFVGSGTTLVACENLGMEGLGFDIDQSYVDYANRTVKQLDSELTATVIARRLKLIQSGVQSVDVRKSFLAFFRSTYYDSFSYSGLLIVHQQQ
ncbi:MAG TPA: site-specific DNA-methyltransferase [Terriglobales bacterium]|nr:site-specific DNA-methyltransferase [Terriglobales bacterium]